MSGECGACISNSSDGEMPDFCDENNPVARKPHVCCECLEPIPVGTRYERVSGKWDGVMSTYTTCLPCAEIRAALCCDGWTYTMLWEDARESLFEGMTTGCLESLTTAEAKAKLLDEWTEWKGLR